MSDPIGNAAANKLASIKYAMRRQFVIALIDEGVTPTMLEAFCDDPDDRFTNNMLFRAFDKAMEDAFVALLGGAVDAAVRERRRGLH